MQGQENNKFRPVNVNSGGVCKINLLFLSKFLVVLAYHG